MTERVGFLTLAVPAADSSILRPSSTLAMQIHIHAPKVDLHAPFSEMVENRVAEVLAPYRDWLTRVEIHFKDENAAKGGVDKRCTLEARPRGLDPIAVDATGTELRETFQNGLAKLSSAIASRYGKLSARRGGNP